MNILITGSTGLLGQALIARLAPRHDVTGLSRRPAAGGGRHVACDLLDPRRTAEAVRASAPALVIHAQALSDVDACERDPAAARQQNVDTTRHLVQALEGSRAALMYVSTDYVFDGMKGAPYTEADEPRPISVYGRSKLEAERTALGHPQAVIVRPSTLFGPGRMNFCTSIASRLTAGQAVEAFADQVTSPTYTEDLADALGELGAALAGPARGGPRIYHAANAGACSRVAFAHRIADALGCRRDLVLAIPMAAQGRPAARPANSSLDSTQLQRVIGRTLRPWDEALLAYLRQGRWLS